jgi:hypothetical protein
VVREADAGTTVDADVRASAFAAADSASRFTRSPDHPPPVWPERMRDAVGERSGKHAKPDAVSAKANVNARVHAPSSAFVAAPLASVSASQSIT